jgi:hypothetical protein
MSRVSHRVVFALCLALLFIAQARLNAATGSSTAAFLATLSSPCEASSNGNAPVDLPLQAPAPTLRVLYPDCGVFCSEYQCSGGYYQESCLDAADKPGRCVPKNVVCPNEPFHSPCWCKPW